MLHLSVSAARARQAGDALRPTTHAAPRPDTSTCACHSAAPPSRSDMSSSAASSSSAAGSAAAAAAAAAASSSLLLGGCTVRTAHSVYLSSAVHYRVHPLVVFSILDHYQRRQDGQARVVGTLLGTVSSDPSTGGLIVEVKQAFPVPHQEEDEAATVEIDYHHSMLALHKQVSPKDIVVGWYSTSGSNETSASAAASSTGPARTQSQIDYVTSLMNEVYRSQMSSGLEPLHLVVDVSMRGGMKVSGFVNQVVRTRVGASPPGSLLPPPAAQEILANFQPVPVEMYSYDEERIGVDALISGVPDDHARLDAPATFLTDQDHILQSIEQILESIETLEAYIAKVVSGKIAQPNLALAGAIHSLLSSLPTLDAATFASTFATHIQDLLAVVYLANMTKNQLAIADKANMLV